MIRSLRGRITAVSTALVSVVLLAASLLIMQMVESDLLDATERALSAELELEAAELELNGFDFDTSLQFFDFEIDGRDFSLGVFVQDETFAVGDLYEFDQPVAEVYIDLDGLQVIAIVDPLTGETIADLGLTHAIEELAFDVRDLDGDEGNRLLVGASAREQVDESLAAVRAALVVIVPSFAVLMGLLIWWLVGRALRPVTAISHQVAAISTINLDRRVAVPRNSNEIAGLASVMNGMLTRLERGDERQRQFAADASHELRSPLSTIRAAAELIERNSGAARTALLAGDIMSEADRMDALVGDLLNLSRLDEDATPVHHELIDLTDLIAGSAGVAARLEADVVVPGDEHQLRRVVHNLVDNALRHARQHVLVTLRTVERDGLRLAELGVEDDGAGVPVNERVTIFERFSRLDEARSRDHGGAGLGLALVKAIVNRHRGSVAVDDSTELGGARFVVHLPVADQMPQSTEEKSWAKAAKPPPVCQNTTTSSGKKRPLSISRFNA